MTETAHEQDYRRQVADVGPTRFLDGSTVEVIREVSLPQPPRYAVFDFDGTLSLIREGWPDVMVPMMLEALRETGTGETDDELSALALDFVMELNGKQTIYQMIRLAEEINKRGGSAGEPLEYKHQYHQRLMQHIEQRRESLRNGSVAADRMLVPFAAQALQQLQDRGVELYLASGTDEQYVREEVTLLGLDDFFGRHIYGARDDYANFSKQMVIERILNENNVDGARLIGFGDGYVEIDNIKSADGTAIAVASDEKGRSGQPDPWKRDRLIGVRADFVIPDFRDCDRLIAYLWNDE